MMLNEDIIIILITVHLITVVLLRALKRIKIFETFRSSITHPAHLGNTAIQIGGLIVIPTVLFSSSIYLYFTEVIPLSKQLPFLIPIILIFLIGFLDDVKSIPAIFRLMIHLANAVSMTVIVFQHTQYAGIEQITAITGLIVPSIIMIIAITWMMNSTNFIDGMDLFLSLNIIPGSLLFALLYLITNSDFTSSMIFAISLSSLLGFVWFNRPQASVYMGDSGALCIGFLLGSSAVYILAKHGSIAGFIPFTYILVDTTFTLFIRLRNGRNILKSHSQHAYQLARKNGKGQNYIRYSCFLISIINTIFAYLSFELNHALHWQLLLGSAAFILSTATYFSLKKTISISKTQNS